jgi:phage terminase large subunit-like protein
VKELLKKHLMIELARRDLWYFCQALHPEYYTDDKTYLKGLCKFLQSDDKRLMINMPPRTGKSFTVALYEAWLFGKNDETKILSISYNDILSGRFSATVRNTISAETTKPEQIVFSDIFPNVKIKRGDASSSLWSLEGQYFSYKGSGYSASLTGFGASLAVIDDLIKNAYEANNAMVLDSHYDFYKNTFMSRLESGGRIIIIMTRWAENDLCGRLLEEQPEDWKMYTVKMEQENGTSLCESIMTTEEMTQKKKSIDPKIWEANYQQNIVKNDLLLYKNGFNFITGESKEPRMIILDIADKGSDAVAGISFIKNGSYYDVYSVFKDSSELIDIEDKIANWIQEQDAKVVNIELNGVGNYFSKQLKKKLPHVTIKGFNTTLNKESKIKASSWWLQENLRFHKSLVYTSFYKELIEFKSEFKANKHDDAPDVCSVIYELFGKRSSVSGGTRI